MISISTISSAKYVFEFVNNAVSLEIDRTPPILKIEYSTEKYINGSIDVKITSNEKIKEVEGWKLKEDGKTLIKTYVTNIQEKIHIEDLSGNIADVEIVIKNIDTISPKAELIKITNTNTGYEKYANKEHEITAQIKIYDDQKIKNNLNDIIVLVGTKEEGFEKQTKIIEEKENYIIYQINLTNIINEGELVFKIPENSFEDNAGNKLVETILNTQIIIDNTAPTTSYSQEILSNGKVLATISSNETLRQMDGWTYNKQINSKEFISDIKYQRPVKDFAGNEAVVDINIQGSTFLGLECMAIISEIGYSGIQNYSVGVMKSGNYRNKFECIIFRTSENVDSDFLKIEAFTNTYWGPGVYAMCKEFNVKFTEGYSGYKTMANSDLVTFQGKKYMNFGGGGANLTGMTDIDGNNRLPLSVASQYKFGVSGIKMDLKEHTEYSIMYQIFYDDTGWLKPCSDGEEAMRAEEQPIEAMRFAVVPISEKKYVLSKWNNDIGTYNID